MNPLADSQTKDNGSRLADTQALVVQVAVIREKFQDYCDRPKIRMF